jgi:hypothetical protein
MRGRAHWPMVLFPAYLVPFSIVLHITTIRVLLANRRRVRGMNIRPSPRRR